MADEFKLEYRKFEKDINVWLKETEQDVEEVVNGVVDEISTNVQRQSPVDTGMFKASWYVNIVSKFKKVIRNDVDYAEPLAMGHSKQAAVGWIDRIIVNALQKFK